MKLTTSQNAVLGALRALCSVNVYDRAAEGGFCLTDSIEILHKADEAIADRFGALTWQVAEAMGLPESSDSTSTVYRVMVQLEKRELVVRSRSPYSGPKRWWPTGIAGDVRRALTAPVSDYD